MSLLSRDIITRLRLVNYMLAVLNCDEKRKERCELAPLIRAALGFLNIFFLPCRYYQDSHAGKSPHTYLKNATYAR